MAEWSTNPALSPIAADVQKIGTWLGTVATAGTVTSPPPDVTTAFANIAAFVDSNC